MWNAQLFRSITSDSATFDLSGMARLHRKDGLYIEDSIMKCMVQQIRNAENSLYMENQYFLGSAFSWLQDRDTSSMHIIPNEITLKISDKIAAEQDFKAYILIPMFPEGDPASVPIQEILYWQFRTMESMYRRIGKAIRAAGLETHPTDYLNFYCLGKRESPDDLPEGLADPEPGSPSEVVRQSCRHPVYVHSKMSIFDDRYILVGSANVNQRSLGGNRDTEIAVGAFQPEHVGEEGACPGGGVQTYRMALWAAHLGGTDESYQNPGSRECLEKVRKVTGDFWNLYSDDTPLDSSVHMLPYPIFVGQDGSVQPLPEPFDCFPDTVAKVLGGKSGYLPGKLTT
jgi:phospholipase D1/2